MYRYEQYDDELDQIETMQRFAYPEIGRYEPEPRYQYVNSARDFTLPLQKHRNVQPIYESPEEG